MPATAKRPRTTERRQRQETPSRAMPRPPDDVDTSTFRGRFGANLRTLRRKKFETREQFREALVAAGMTTTMATISRWESGRNIPELNEWPIIAAVLGCDVRRLLPPS